MVSKMLALPPSTPAVSTYPCQTGTQFAKNNLRPTKRTFKRVPSGQEDDAALKKILRHYWGHDDFRGPQLAICRDAMRDTDLLVVAPTGLGKSVCFQVPAMAREYGVTIVVAPLLFAGMRAKGIDARCAYGELSAAEKQEIKKQLSMGHPEMRILYVTPEALMTASTYRDAFDRAYRTRQLNRIVIDEAHLIDEWGKTFRPVYRQLGEIRERFPDLPFTALTASAAPAVRQDIINVLRIRRSNLAQYVEPFNRKNLFYEVRYRGRGDPGDGGDEPPPPDSAQEIASLIKCFRAEAAKINEKNGVRTPCVSGIVYTRSRGDAEGVASTLARCGVSARPYHAKLPEHVKDAALVDWKACRIECIVATIAFGMGIDHPHVRYVVHYDMPKSFEGMTAGYYQETGRAGRDGHMSRCILYYEREDAKKAYRQILGTAGALARDENGRRGFHTLEEAASSAKRMVDSFKSIQELAENTTTCRHIVICRYFGEKVDEAQHKTIYCGGMCDICSNATAVRLRSMTLTEDVEVASQIVPNEDVSTLVPALDSASTAGLESSLEAFHSFDAPETATAAPPQRAAHTPACTTQPILLERLPGIDPTVFGRNSAAGPPTLRTSAPRQLARSPLGVISPKPPAPLLSRTGPTRTFEQVLENGIAAPGMAVVLGSMPSPSKAEEKKRARDKAFEGVEAVSGEGLFPMYNSAAPKQRKVLSSKKTFKTPFIRVVNRDPSAHPPSTAALSLPPTPDHSNGWPDGMRKKGMQDIREAMQASLIAGAHADKVWQTWGRTEQDEARSKVIHKASREVEAAIAVECTVDNHPNLDTYLKAVHDMMAAAKVPRSDKGVDAIVSGYDKEKPLGKRLFDIERAVRRVRQRHGPGAN